MDEDLSESFPKKYLPVDCGGENGSLDKLWEEQNKIWDIHRNYFKQNAEYGSDESLRPGKELNCNNDLGIGGSFRKINVD